MFKSCFPLSRIGSVVKLTEYCLWDSLCKENSRARLIMFTVKNLFSVHVKLQSIRSPKGSITILNKHTHWLERRNVIKAECWVHGWGLQLIGGCCVGYSLVLFASLYCKRTLLYLDMHGIWENPLEILKSKKGKKWRKWREKEGNIITETFWSSLTWISR